MNDELEKGSMNNRATAAFTSAKKSDSTKQTVRLADTLLASQAKQHYYCWQQQISALSQPNQNKTNQQ